jgi:chromosome partitioning protein
MNLAAATALTGARVLLLDTDPLSSISSSLNLAQNAGRQPLRQAGLDLPGVLVTDVVPGLDVLSPYEGDGCSDRDLDHLLAVLAVPELQDGYDCLIVDTPPFLGANSGQLLATCDQFILVMRAEPLAYRTLPAFLELVQRSRGRAIAMRGILLTLPEGETPGGRCERELRGRFGTRILSQVIPHDEAVRQAVLFAQIVCQTNKDAPAAAAYHALVEALDLAGPPAARRSGEASERRSVLAALRLASKAVRPKPASGVRQAAPVVPAAPVLTPLHETPLPSRTTPSGVRRVAVVPSGAPEPPANPRRGRTTQVAAIPVVGQMESRVQSWSEPVVKTPEPPAPTPRAPEATPRGSKPQPASRGSVPSGVALLWVVVGMIAGIGLRFVQLPDVAIQVLVGLGVSLVVVLVLRPSQAEPPKDQPPAPPRSRTVPRRSEGRSDPGKRPSGLKRRVSPVRKLGDD